MLTRVLVFREIGQLFVASKDNKAHPLVVARNVVDFYTDKRICSHPIYFLADGADRIEIIVIVIVGEIDRHDIRLLVTRATYPADQ